MRQGIASKRLETHSTSALNVLPPLPVSRRLKPIRLLVPVHKQGATDRRRDGTEITETQTV